MNTVKQTKLFSLLPSEWIFLSLAIIELTMEFLYLNSIWINQILLMVFLYTILFKSNRVLSKNFSLCLKIFFLPLIFVIQYIYHRVVYLPMRTSIFGLSIPIILLLITLTALILSIWIGKTHSYKNQIYCVLGIFIVLFWGGRIYNNSFYIPNYQLRRYVNNHCQIEGTLEEKAKNLISLERKSWLKDLRNIDKLPNLQQVILPNKAVNLEGLLELKELSFLTINQSYSRVLNNLNSFPHLQTLCLNLSEDSPRTFVLNGSCSLKRLYVDNITNDQIGYLPEVKFLRIYSHEKINLDFSENLPSLESLTVFFTDIEDIDDILKNKNLKEFTYYSHDNIDYSEFLKEHGIEYNN